MPRTDIGVVSGKRKRVKREEMSAQQQQAQLLDINVEDTANPATVVKAFKVRYLMQGMSLTRIYRSLLIRILILVFCKS